MTATLILLQLTTGLLLKFAYIPASTEAYDSVRWIVAGMPFGRLIRNLHYWGSHLLVALAGLHMLRVFLTGAFHPPRQFNWIVGLGLLTTVLAANFTGYLLPWDQLAFWAVTVSTGMLAYVPLVGGGLQAWLREGSEVGPATLQVFYSLHTAVVPSILAGLMGYHFWRVRKAKGVVIPRRPEEPMEDKPELVPTVRDLLLREVVVALVLVAAMLQISFFFDAPMGDPANPGLSPNPTRAPWYFAGLQELLLHIHPVLAVCMVPAVAGGALLLIPYLKYPVNSSGIWFVSRIGGKASLVAVLAGVLSTAFFIYLEAKWFSEAKILRGFSPLISKGLLPIFLLFGSIALFYLAIRKLLRVNLNEALQSIFILLFSAYGVLTIVSLWFRGAGMELALPW
jgi:quinol-cytochrome oxidoreductase complex cytochrome b subunit